MLADALKLKDRSSLEFVVKECDDEVIRMSAEKALNGKVYSCLLIINNYYTIDRYQFVYFFLYSMSQMIFCQVIDHDRSPGIVFSCFMNSSAIVSDL